VKRVEKFGAVCFWGSRHDSADNDGIFSTVKMHLHECVLGNMFYHF
jgi:hypothetical protein